MRALFLTKYPPSQASSRYCVYQYLPYFESQGIDCVASPFYDERSFTVIFGDSRLIHKCCVFLWCLLRRLSWIFSLRKFDLVVSHRECVPIGPILFERLIGLLSVPFVFIYDDALFVFKRSSNHRVYDLFKSPNKFYRIFQQADLVIGANDHLAKVARDVGANAKTLRVGENLDRYTTRTPVDNGDIRIGWIGSPSTEKYLELVREPLESIGRRFPGTKMLVIGGGKFKLNAIDVEHAKWCEVTEVSNLHRMDIGLMPLPQEEWALGKSGGKARLYMAVGIVPVVTDIGFNQQLIDDYQTGRLIGQSDQWEPAIEELIVNYELRDSISKQARATIEQHYSVEVTGPRYLAMLREVVGDSSAAPSSS